MIDKLPRKVRDIRGERFGRLLVESLSHIADNKSRNAYWLCKCDCGNTTTVSSGSLRKGCTKSCGCLAAEVSRKTIKKLHNKGRHLYFIRSKEYIKIGRADNPKLRLSQIKTANPFGGKIVLVLPDQGFREKEMHERFKDKHLTGEWFELSDEEVVSIGNVQDG